MTTATSSSSSSAKEGGNGHAMIFFDGIRRTKDRDSLRKIIRSCLDVVPWSWDTAMSYA